MFEYDDNPQQPPMQPQPQPAQPQQNVPGEIELPFGPDDALELQRLTKTYARVGTDRTSNIITPVLATQTRAQLAPRIQELTQRQKAAQASQAAQANMQAMQQAAQQQGIANVHMEQAMKMLPQLVAHIVDPVTGETESFAPMPDGKGGFKVEAIKFERAQKKAEMYYSGQGADAGDGDAQLPPLGSSPMTLGLGLAAQTPGMNAPLPAGSEAGLDQTSPVSLEQFAARESGQGATVTPPDTVAGTPRILNSLGENIDRRLVPRQEPPETPGMLSEKQIAAMYQKAQRQVPSLPANATPEQVMHQQTAIHHLVQLQVQHAQGLESGRQVIAAREQQHRHDKAMAGEEARNKERFAAQEAKLKREGIAEEHKRQEEARAEAAGNGKFLGADRMHKMLTHHIDAAAKKAGDLTLANRQEWMNSEEGIHEQGVKNFTAAMKVLGYDQKGKRMEEGSAGSTPASASPAEQKKAFQAVGTSGGLPGDAPPKSAGSGESVTVSPERMAQILPHVQVIADHFKKSNAPGNLQKDADTMLAILKKGSLTPADHAVYDLHKQSLFNGLKGPNGPQDTSVLDLLGPGREEGGKPATAPAQPPRAEAAPAAPSRPAAEGRPGLPVKPAALESPHLSRATPEELAHLSWLYKTARAMHTYTQPESMAGRDAPPAASNADRQAAGLALRLYQKTLVGGKPALSAEEKAQYQEGVRVLRRWSRDTDNHSPLEE